MSITDADETDGMPISCKRCARLLRLLEIEQDKDRRADESIVGLYRMAQANGAHLKKQLAMSCEDVVLSIMEGIAFDQGIDWKDIRRGYDELEEKKRNDLRGKVFELARLIAESGGFE